MRRITAIDKLFDVSVVDVPAYEQTEIYARSKETISEELKKYHEFKFEKEKLKLKLKI